MQTSFASRQIPRTPTVEEREELAAALAEYAGIDDQEHANGLVESAYIAVFDHYITGSPGYTGKVLAVVWDDSPTLFDVFAWNNGKMQRQFCERCEPVNALKVKRLVNAAESVADELTEILNSSSFSDEQDEDTKRISESLDELAASVARFQSFIRDQSNGIGPE